jgi:hypothetical protein
VELSVKVPVAVNCLVTPRTTLEFPGVIAKETRVAAVTVMLVELVTLPRVALMDVTPAATGVMSPAAETVAVPELAVVQVTEEVRF